jgi:hypothetical protein
MPSDGYILRQAQFLLRFANSVSNPEMRAKLVGKAADLILQFSTGF